jgi:hypothetical protein
MKEICSDANEDERELHCFNSSAVCTYQSYEHDSFDLLIALYSLIRGKEQICLL